MYKSITNIVSDVTVEVQSYTDCGALLEFPV